MRREEWRQQVELCRLLDRWLPADAFWTATDPIATSAMSGAMRRLRGVKPGLPDTLVWHRRKSITIEMKSRQGRCSAAQRAAREALIRAGAEWWMCRTANAAMWALKKSGVRFRTLVRVDGVIERFRQPKLAPWEAPRRDPAERRPNAPEVVAQRRAAQARWRERQRALETAKSATERDGGAQPAGCRNTPGNAISIGDDCAGTRAKALPRRAQSEDE